MSHNYHWKSADFSTLEGLTLRKVAVSKDEDEIIFITKDGVEYRQYHSQDCCESVNVDTVIGDLDDLVDTPILEAREAMSIRQDEIMAHFMPQFRRGDDESQTWTFYTLRTIKGSVDIRWYGTSNGYYSERVDFAMVPKQEE